MSEKRTLAIIYFSTVVTIGSLYAAQPIQPLFQEEFCLNRFQAILFTTLMMVPLGFAPLLYGFILESYSSKSLVRGAILFLGLLEILFASADHYLVLLSIRAVQGLTIPAILTSLMSYISHTSSIKNMQKAIAFYIAATIIGGFLGRFLSGLLTELYNYRLFFYILGGCLVSCFFLLSTLKKDVNLHYTRPDIVQIKKILTSPQVLWIYFSIFLIFFVFSGLLNFLPFKLKQLDHSMGEADIGLIYLGYSMGVVAAVNIPRIITLFGTAPKAAKAATLLYLIATALFLLESQWIIFGAMFVFCFGMFTVHALLSGYVNTLATKSKGITNGLYISFYYTGGCFGSFAPGVIYEYMGWSAFIFSLMATLLLAFVFISRIGGDGEKV
ncbi:MAG: MFS transporter [Thermodesulfobacteriota bacterium]